MPAAPQQPLDPSISSQLTRSAGRPVYVWSVSGSLDPRRVAQVELRTAYGVLTAATADGFFFVQLGQQTPGPSSAPAFPPGEHVLVARDASGAVVARLDLNALHREATPRQP